MNNSVKRLHLSIIEKSMHTWFNINSLYLLPFYIYIYLYINCQRSGCTCNKTFMLGNE